jgi:integrase/recombinase XerD
MSCGRLSRVSDAWRARFDAAHKEANAIFVQPLSFTQLCRQLGLWPADDSRRPSLHALRHAFAIERIRCWYQEGADVQALLPHLSVYLGHVRPQESYWYLTATPELLGAAAARFQHYAARGEDL